MIDNLLDKFSISKVWKNPETLYWLPQAYTCDFKFYEIENSVQTVLENSTAYTA